MKKLLILIALFLPMALHSSDKGVAVSYEVYDGDTLTNVTIDIGWDLHLTNQRIRIFGIDTPETRTKDLEEKERAKVSTQALKDLLKISTKVKVIFVKKDSFGRLLCHLIAVTSKGEIDVADYMLSTGMATEYQSGVAKK